MFIQSTMASSDSSDRTDVFSDSDISLDSSEGDYGVVNLGANIPYQNEPLAIPGQPEVNFEEDIDGIAHDVLEGRSEGRIVVGDWCNCAKCRTENLTGALEFRCCQEINEAGGKLEFEGREDITCIAQHGDYIALTEPVVLTQVGPLLRDSKGRSYRQRAGQSRNEYLRAVAYRWIVRWLFGYLGWDNRRPLPACIYHDIRVKFPSQQNIGYAETEGAQ